MKDRDGKSDIYLELLTKISEQANSTQTAIADLDKKVDLHIQKTQFELTAINKLDEVQNDLLDKHIAGVDTLKQMFEAQKAVYNAKFERIEAPRKMFKLAKDSLLWIAAIAGAVLGVIKYIF